MTTLHQRRFSWRAFVSLVAAVQLLLLAVSGLLLFSAPACGVAARMGWAVAGLSKEQWQAVHVNTGLVFLAISTWHLVYNWKALLHYLRGRLGAARCWRLEPLYAGLFGLLLVLGPATDMAPFGQVTRLSERLSAAWIDHDSAAGGQSWGQMNLAELCEAAGLSLPRTIDRLAGLGLAATGGTSVRTVADALGLPPSQVASALR